MLRKTIPEGKEKKKKNLVHHQIRRKRGIKCKSISGHVFCNKKNNEAEYAKRTLQNESYYVIRKMKTDFDSKWSSYGLYLFQGMQNCAHTQY